MAASCGGGVLPSSSGQYHLQANTKAVASSVGGASGNSVLPICSKRGSENNSKKQSLLSQTFVPVVGPKFSRGLAKGNNNGATQEHRSLVSVRSEHAKVVCFGELLIDFVPTVGGLALADAPAFKKAPGGAPANVAVGIARLGGNSAFVGKVGDDEFGVMLVNVLKDNHVDTKGCVFDANARTALAFVTLRHDGEREFMFYRNPSADMLFEPHELDLTLLQEAAILHYGSISLITEPSRSTHMEAMRIAKEAGAVLSYDPNLRLPLWSSAEAAREGIRSIWNQADIIKVSDEEVKFLTGGDSTDDENNLKLFHPGCKLMLVTEGGEGCRYYTPKFRGTVEGLKVEVVDTTGAGDAFCAGILSQLGKDSSVLENEDRLREALKFANACGAITVTERGAIPALPDMDTVLSFISEVPA
ncbi:unnamed protein product [Sphagnum jensenii]|uniref:fructokinase n=1 Tax=Sphagnum jensenii TaxID=128206 RepID=A0ABP1A2R0_9BRYO